MSEPFLGQIQLVAFNFAPEGWALCNGQLLPIQQNVALFSLLGTQFGGNGTSNFALPNLQGMAPLSQGQGAGLSNYVVGESGGQAAVTLTESTVPEHTHTLPCTTAAGHATAPSPSVYPGTVARGEAKLYNTSETSGASMASGALATVGSSAAHNNLTPYLVLNYIIAMTGIFPSRN
jgi:microcystin-dependent protein